jgi:hypothetical protein
MTGKISEDALAALADAVVLPVVDLSQAALSDQNRKTTIGALATYLNALAGTLTNKRIDNLISNGAAATAPHVDYSGQTAIGLTDGTSAAITPSGGTVQGYELTIVERIAFGGMAKFLLPPGANGVMAATTSSFFAVGNGTATKVSVGWDAGTNTHRVYNACGFTCSFKVELKRIS